VYPSIPSVTRYVISSFSSPRSVADFRSSRYGTELLMSYLVLGLIARVSICGVWGACELRFLRVVMMS
jgi:hypothetical protein